MLRARDWSTVGSPPADTPESVSWNSRDISRRRSEKGSRKFRTSDQVIDPIQCADKHGASNLLFRILRCSVRNRAASAGVFTVFRKVARFTLITIASFGNKPSREIRVDSFVELDIVLPDNVVHRRRIKFQSATIITLDKKEKKV